MKKLKRNLAAYYVALEGWISGLHLNDGDRFDSYQVTDFFKNLTGNKQVLASKILPTFSKRTRKNPARFGYYLEPLAGTSGDGPRLGRYVYRVYVPPPQPAPAPVVIEIPRGPGRPPLRETEWARLGEQISTLEFQVGKIKASIAKLRADEDLEQGTLIK